jgi:hypothetical protein
MVAGSGSVTPKKSDAALSDSRCKATCKKTGLQCGRWAVQGSHVCTVHGAGAPVRRGRPAPDGRLRQDPRTAPVKHGLYARRVQREVRAAVQEYCEDREALYGVDAVVARLWVLLERCDSVEATIEVPEDPGSADLALRALGATGQVLTALSKAILSVEKIRHRRTISAGAAVTMLLRVLGWADELSQDSDVAREDIARLLARRMDDYAAKLDVASGGSPRVSLADLLMEFRAEHAAGGGRRQS